MVWAVTVKLNMITVNTVSWYCRPVGINSQSEVAAHVIIDSYFSQKTCVSFLSPTGGVFLYKVTLQH